MMTRTPDEIKKGLSLYTPEEVKAILQQKWTIHLQEKLYRSAFVYIQQLERDKTWAGETSDMLREENKRLEAQNAEILKKVEQLQAERDAAVEDLKYFSDCRQCNSWKTDENCRQCRPGHNSWQWRGVQKEE